MPRLMSLENVTANLRLILSRVNRADSAYLQELSLDDPRPVNNNMRLKCIKNLEQVKELDLVDGTTINKLIKWFEYTALKGQTYEEKRREDHRLMMQRYRSSRGIMR